MRVYLAGPMTGIPQFNFPAFDAAAADLRGRGVEVMSPAELDRPEVREQALASPDGAEGATEETWGQFLARDVQIVADEVDAVCFLPGWEGSKGAKLEAMTGLLAGKGFYRYVEDADLEPLDPDTVRRAILAEPDLTVRRTGPDAGEVRVTNERTGGQKGTKPQRFELVPYGAVARIAEVYAFGASKYAAHNWRKGYEWSLSFGALMRHLAAWWEGENIDPESGLSHLAHAGFHVLALLEYEANARYTDLDDRPHHALRS